MKLLPPLSFAVGYFLGGWGVIWILVALLKQGDPKFAESVGFYYALWIIFYMPIAICGVISIAKFPGMFQRRMIVAGVSLFFVLAAMSASFALNIHWYFILLEFFVFGVISWIAHQREIKTVR